MKAGAVLLALCWFAASAYAGYRLTERSFRWIDQPNFGVTEVKTAPSKSGTINLDALKGKVPAPLLEQAKTLTTQQLLCLQASISPSRIPFVLQGNLTAQEAAAVKTCLK